MKQARVEVNYPNGTIRVNDIDISLEVLEAITRPDEEKLFRFRRLAEKVVICSFTDELASVFNKWMDRFVSDPERFAREWQVVGDYLEQKAAGFEPDYGQKAAAYLTKLITEA